MPKSCYCSQPLRPDGTCPFRCPPGLAKPGYRQASKAAKPDTRSPTFTMAEREHVRKTLRAVDPVFRAASNQARRAGRKSSRS